MTLVRATLDANVLVYAFQAGDHRQAAATEILGLAMAARCPLPLQALGEFFVATTRKGYLTKPQARTQVQRWLDLFPPPWRASEASLRLALEASEAGRFSYWDALLLATAGEAGCEAVISEDMAHGAALGPVRVVRAFAGAAVSAAARDLLA